MDHRPHAAATQQNHHNQVATVLEAIQGVLCMAPFAGGAPRTLEQKLAALT